MIISTIYCDIHKKYVWWYLKIFCDIHKKYVWWYVFKKWCDIHNKYIWLYLQYVVIPTRNIYDYIHNMLWYPQEICMMIFVNFKCCDIHNILWYQQEICMLLSTRNVHNIEALMLPKTSEYIATIFFENWAVRDWIGNFHFAIQKNNSHNLIIHAFKAIQTKQYFLNTQ